MFRRRSPFIECSCDCGQYNGAVSMVEQINCSTVRRSLRAKQLYFQDYRFYEFLEPFIQQRDHVIQQFDLRLSHKEAG